MATIKLTTTVKKVGNDQSSPPSALAGFKKGATQDLQGHGQSNSKLENRWKVTTYPGAGRIECLKKSSCGKLRE